MPAQPPFFTPTRTPTTGSAAFAITYLMRSAAASVSLITWGLGRGLAISVLPSGLHLLERDDFSSNHHPALTFCLSMIFFRKPVPTFRDHALIVGRAECARLSARSGSCASPSQAGGDCVSFLPLAHAGPNDIAYPARAGGDALLIYRTAKAACAVQRAAPFDPHGSPATGSGWATGGTHNQYSPPSIQIAWSGALHGARRFGG